MGTPSRRKRTGVASTGVKAPLASLPPMQKKNYVFTDCREPCTLLSTLFIYVAFKTVCWADAAKL